MFTDLLLVDEINRMPPRTQAALLEAMEERQVDDRRHEPSSLARPFTTFATQNPVEFEGTYPLPEAELDRFFVKIHLGYPDTGGRRGGSHSRAASSTASMPGRSMRWISIRSNPTERGRGTPGSAVGRGRARAIRLHRRDGTPDAGIGRRITLGASPRGAIHLMQLAKAMAAMDGRDYLLPDDVKRAAPPVLRHRLVLTPEADLDGLTPDQVIAEVLAAVEVPK